MAILIVEDDADLLDILTFTFRRGGFDSIPARAGDAGLRVWQTKHPELVVLDADLPTLSGWEVCRQIREASTTPVIMLTAAAREADVVKGLELGADDYITKPFSPKELVARVRTVLRRAITPADEPRKGWQVLTSGDLRLDPQWRRVVRGDIEVMLTPMEFKLLYELILNQGQVLSHSQLADRIWGDDGVDDSSLLKGHIRNLRRKLEENPAKPVYIHTAAGIGYSFSNGPNRQNGRSAAS